MIGDIDEVSRIQIDAGHSDEQGETQRRQLKDVDESHISTDRGSGAGVKDPAPVDRTHIAKPEVPNAMEGEDIPLPKPTGEEMEEEDDVDKTDAATYQDGRILSLEAKRTTDEGTAMAKALSRKFKIGLVEIEPELREHDNKYTEKSRQE